MQTKFDNVMGENFNLVELSFNYLDDMHEYSIDSRMYEFFEFLPNHDYQSSKKYLEALMERSNNNDAHWWFIQEKNNLKVIGSIGVHGINYRRGSCEISYAVSPNYWGKGAFSEALSMTIETLFSKFNLNRITAVTMTKNHRSIHALKKAGFKEEGIFKEFYLTYAGKRVDATSLALLSSEYINLMER